MPGKWLLSFVLLVAVSGPCLAAKPVRSAAVAAPEVFSVKIDYAGGFIVVEGTALDPATAAATIAGVGLSIDGSSTDTTLMLPFSPAAAAAVDELGNYVIQVTTDAGGFTLSAFVPFALVQSPTPPPPGPDCPCSPEWDDKSSAAPPDGFAGLTPYCSEDSANWVTVQFDDNPRYWVLWTEWSDATASGSCELWIDSPGRPLDSHEQFNACANYLRNIVTVWGSQGNDCLF